MKVLLIGHGGREEALSDALKRSRLVDSVVRARDSLSMSIPQLLNLADREHVGFTVVGSEEYLVAGITDAFLSAGKKIFGPSKAAAMLEGSKVETALFCKAYGIPAPPFDIAVTPQQAMRIVEKRQAPIVIKQDGLARGKGVAFARTYEEARKAVYTFSQMPAGKRLLIQEPLIGQECSYIVVTDGIDYVPLRAVRDYKETFQGSKVFTGGMGCRTLAREEFPETLETMIQKTIIEPILWHLWVEDRSFTGALYAGLMIVNGFPYVLECNARFGNPETQAQLELYRNSDVDIFPYLYATATGAMRYRFLPQSNNHVVCVVLADEGYPGELIHAGAVISGIEHALRVPGAHIYFGGAEKKPDGSYAVTRGRVMDIVCVASTLKEAAAGAYKAVQHIHFDGMWYRNDIGR